jgi:hypothetical protein
MTYDPDTLLVFINIGAILFCAALAFLFWIKTGL